jgi:hypothetical protein
MNSPDILQYMSSISVMKNTTGSVSVSTPTGPVILQVPGFRYQLAKTPEEVTALLRQTNLGDLLRKRIVSLVF